MFHKKKFYLVNPWTKQILRKAFESEREAFRLCRLLQGFCTVRGERLSKSVYKQFQVIG